MLQIFVKATYFRINRFAHFQCSSFNKKNYQNGLAYAGASSSSNPSDKRYFAKREIGHKGRKIKDVKSTNH